MLDSPRTRRLECKILFKAAAGPKIGLGHLSRCSSLASALQKIGATCLFLDDEHHIIRDRLARFGDFQTTDIGSGDEYERACEVAKQMECRAVVVDSYDATAQSLNVLRKSGTFIVHVDDLGEFASPCHMLINSSPMARRLSYVSVHGDTHFLLGSEYALLRPEFCMASSKNVGKDVERILLTFGAGNSTQLVDQIILMLQQVKGSFSLNVIDGPLSEGTKIDEGSCIHPVRIIRDPASMRDLMLDADFAISGGGQTLFELCATGTPIVAVQVAENQAMNLRGFQEEGALWFAGSVEEERTPHNVVELTQKLIDDYPSRLNMSHAGQRTVDGKGAIRVSSVLAELLS